MVSASVILFRVIQEASEKLALMRDRQGIGLLRILPTKK